MNICSTIMSLVSWVSVEDIIFDVDASSAHVAVVIKVCRTPHGMYDVKGVARKVGHVALEFVSFEVDVGLGVCCVRSLVRLKVWSKNVYSTAKRADIFWELIIREYDRALIQLDQEWAHSLIISYKLQIVELPARVR